MPIFYPLYLLYILKRENGGENKIFISFFFLPPLYKILFFFIIFFFFLYIFSFSFNHPFLTLLFFRPCNIFPFFFLFSFFLFFSFFFSFLFFLFSFLSF